MLVERTLGIIHAGRLISFTDSQFARRISNIASGDQLTEGRVHATLRAAEDKAALLFGNTEVIDALVVADIAARELATYPELRRPFVVMTAFAFATTLPSGEARYERAAVLLTAALGDWDPEEKTPPEDAAWLFKFKGVLEQALFPEGFSEKGTGDSATVTFHRLQIKDGHALVKLLNNAAPSYQTLNPTT